MLLNKLGLICEFATDGAEAVALVKSYAMNYFDFIFLDNVMPNMVCKLFLIILLTEFVGWHDANWSYYVFMIKIVVVGVDGGALIQCGPDAAVAIRKLGFTHLIIGVTGALMMSFD